MFNAGALPLLSFILLCACATQDSIGRSLPAEMSINKDAGRWGLIIVMPQLENGQKLPFIVDTGAGRTLFDKTCEPILGKLLGTTVGHNFGDEVILNDYTAPKLSLGGARLRMTGSVISTYDFRGLSSHLGRPVMGVLGIDVLEHYCLQFDFAAGKVRFLDSERCDKQKWGKPFPVVPLSSKDGRPTVNQNLLGTQNAPALIDTGCNYDGWLRPESYRHWTNEGVMRTNGEAHWPHSLFGGERYPFVSLQPQEVGTDGIGLRFLARHMVTLDFPNHTLYLLRQSAGPLDETRPRTARRKALEPVIAAVSLEEVEDARQALAGIEQSRAPELEKTIARKLVASLENEPKLTPVNAPTNVLRLPLGDARPELAEVGWLKPAANRIPLNEVISSPLLDSGKVYASGLFACAPSRYVYCLGGKWKRLRGKAGLHTAFQLSATGVVFVIKADGKEVFRSSIIRKSQQAKYDVDLTDVQRLDLLVEKAGDRNEHNWSLWLEPALFR